MGCVSGKDGLSMKAETYIDSLKTLVDSLTENYGQKEHLKAISYGTHGYGILQRVELEEITQIIIDLKKKVDELAEECETISAQKHKLCVLVVDDNTDFLNMVGMFLQKNGIEADMASNGLEALELLQADSQKYAMVLLDIQMEQMDGFGLLGRLRGSESADLRTKPVVAMSGKAKSSDCAGFDYFLRKPFDLDEFIPTIRKVLVSRSV